MALRHKPGPAEVTNLLGQLPDPPSLPADMLERFESLKGYDAAFQTWWIQASKLLQMHIDQIQDKFDKLDRK